MPQGPAIFDRALLRRRRQRARTLGPETFLLDRAADDLGERLGAVLREFGTAVDLGTPTDALRRAVAATGKVATLVRASQGGGANAGLHVIADEEALPFGNGSLDLIVSVLALHFVNDLPGTLIQARRALKPDGLLLAAMLGGDTLSERRRTPLRRATLRRLAEIYAERFADPDGRLRATFEIVWLSGWAPHESQQKPLKPGSASRRLADALGAQEIPAGDKQRR
ncbi:MAG TPA: methyltransferase domain-containing protein [Pseudolabrys sp.]|nr:methyltransferase domain-containing protein [Pseudolabrys sp.]